MNEVDRQYLFLLNDIITNGVKKKTRSGEVRSVFGRTMRFDLTNGLPILTTKKVYVKGIIHELLWFLKGDTNIKYLVDNNVNIWNDDAYRWFKSIVPDFKMFKRKDVDWINGYYKFDWCVFEPEEISCSYAIVINNVEKGVTVDELLNLPKDEFINLVKKNAHIKRFDIFNERTVGTQIIYYFGDLGDVYGKQWRRFGNSNTDQIQKIIDTLKTNPDDRRMVLTAWNPDVIDDIALPACHMFAQFWTRELTNEERIGLFYEKYNINKELYEFEKTGLKEHTKEYLFFQSYYYIHSKTKITQEQFIDIINRLYDIPKRELSLSFTCRSQDFPIGTPYNILSYSLLCHIIANICNMTVGEIIYNGGDVHIYENQLEGCKEQLKRQGYDELPTLKIKRQLTNVDDIKYDDFEIVGYKSDPAIKYPLSVG